MLATHPPACNLFATHNQTPPVRTIDSARRRAAAKTRLVAAGVPDGPLSHFAASGVAGTVSAVFSTPYARLWRPECRPIRVPAITHGCIHGAS